MRHATKILYLVLCFAVSGKQSSTAAEDSSAPLGRKEWLPVTNGLVFIDGKFISPPYTVSCVEGDILINGTPVMTALKWPPHVNVAREPPETLPLLPPTVTEHSTPYDKECREYIGTSCWYLTAKYGRVEGIRRLVKIYAQMPCVVHAQLSEEDMREIAVTWKTGETIHTVHGENTPAPKITREEALRHVNRLARIYVDGLGRSQYFVLGSGMRMGTHGGFIQTFTPLADAMRAAKDEEDYLSIMKTNQPPGGMSEKTLRLFYQYKDDLPKWDPQSRIAEPQ